MTPDLRDRLRGMRDVLLGLENQIDAGHLTLLAGINAALLAVDAQAVAAEDAAQAVVADDGSAIRLVLYREAEAIAAVTVEPAPHCRRRIQLKTSRGGDLRWRDDTLRSLAPLKVGGLKLEQRRTPQ